MSLLTSEIEPTKAEAVLIHKALTQYTPTPEEQADYNELMTELTREMTDLGYFDEETE